MTAIGAQNKAAADIAYDDLITRYSEPQRHYHTPAHLDHLLALFEKHRTEFKNPATVLAAIFFHDAVYDPAATPGMNELHSANLAIVTLAALSNKLSAEMAGVHRLIWLTASHKLDKADPDAALFLDMDMAILGSDQNTYDAYAAQVRREYAPLIGTAAYNQGRLHRFILPVLAQKRIFITDTFENTYGARARANLAREEKTLRKMISNPAPGP